MKIDVYDSDSDGSEPAHTFKSAKAFYTWQEANAPNLNADDVAVNDILMYGWDEIEMEIGGPVG